MRFLDGSRNKKTPQARTRRYILFLPTFILLLLMGLGLRIIDLDADPPGSISWSEGPFTDGAVVVHNARNKTLFDEWIVDYCKDLYLFPLSNVVAYATFEVAGVYPILR